METRISVRKAEFDLLTPLLTPSLSGAEFRKLHMFLLLRVHFGGGVSPYPSFSFDKYLLISKSRFAQQIPKTRIALQLA